jgi:hypothetical protein
MRFPGYERVGGKIVSFNFVNDKLARASQFSMKEQDAYKEALAQLLDVDAAQVVINGIRTGSSDEVIIGTQIRSLDTDAAMTADFVKKIQALSASTTFVSAVNDNRKEYLPAKIDAALAAHTLDGYFSALGSCTAAPTAPPTATPTATGSSTSSSTGSSTRSSTGSAEDARASTGSSTSSSADDDKTIDKCICPASGSFAKGVKCNGIASDWSTTIKSVHTKQNVDTAVLERALGTHSLEIGKFRVDSITVDGTGIVDVEPTNMPTAFPTTRSPTPAPTYPNPTVVKACNDARAKCPATSSMATLGTKLKSVCGPYINSLVAGAATTCSAECIALVETSSTRSSLDSDALQLCVNYWGLSKRCYTEGRSAVDGGSANPAFAATADETDKQVFFT